MAAAYLDAPPIALGMYERFFYFLLGVTSTSHPIPPA
jgi:hypothetical protein